MKLLVVGGAGFIGSHMTKMLAMAGHEVIILDNLSTGHADSVHYGKLIVGSIADTSLLDSLFTAEHFDAVLHFAAFSLVSESVTNPSVYYRNNVSNTLNLLDAMVRHGVLSLVFSSSAAIFGNPLYTPIDENHPQTPINPYGHSKLMVEDILRDYDLAYGLRSVSLRYFNAAGADPEGKLGERHTPETHLIPLIMQAASGRKENITVFGKDYPTPDGTCIRDYIHVHDLCTAHLLSLEWLLETRRSAQFNLGNESGFSVLDIIKAAQDVTGIEINIAYGERRQGDPGILVADASLAKKTLGWNPVFSSISTIIEHAWKWELTHFCNRQS
jgi:UDP-glucose 4-epimerase